MLYWLYLNVVNTFFTESKSEYNYDKIIETKGEKREMSEITNEKWTVFFVCKSELFSINIIFSPYL